jgi:hypothetical protein
MPMDSKQATLGAVVISGGILTARALREGDLGPRTYAGLAVVTVFLFGISAFSPELAAALAVLVLVSLLLGSDDIQNLVDVFTTKKGGNRRGR